VRESEGSGKSANGFMTLWKYSFFTLSLCIYSFSFAQKLYVAENGAQQLSRSNADGSLQEVVSAAGDIGNILDIAVDPVTNKVYWIEKSLLLSTVRRAPLVSQAGTVKLGTPEIFVQIPLSILNAFEALTIDHVARELYVTNSSAGSIFKVSLDAALGGAVLAESTLSFLGLGPSTSASWGSLLDQGSAVLLRFPHVALLAGAAIAVTVLCFNLAGDGLRDLLDPRG
jgi:hypothetical protein